jgi:hypothetical protein
VQQADIDTAVALARAAVGAPNDVPAEALPVRRLDRDACYVLVRLGRGGEPGWLAAVDPSAEDVLTWARNPTGEPTVPSTSEGELVWRPSKHSRSPLYPLLRTSTPDGEMFIDLSGTRWTALPDSRG